MQAALSKPPCAGDDTPWSTGVMAPATNRPHQRVIEMFNDNGSFPPALFEFFLFFAWIMCLFWVFGDIFRSRDLGGVTKDALGALRHLCPGTRGLGLPDRPGRRHDRTLLEQQKELQAAQAGTSRPPPGRGRRLQSRSRRRKSLLDAGTITQDEFDAMKAKALA